MFIFVCLLWLGSSFGSTSSYIYVTTRNDGFNNQMIQIWLNLYLAKLYNRTAVLSDMWPDWSWDKADHTYHFPFTKYFLVNQTVVKTAPLHQLTVDCPNGLTFFGNAELQWWKTDLFKIKHAAIVTNGSMYKWLDYAPPCAGINTAAAVPTKPIHLSYHQTVRQGIPQWVAVRKAVTWSDNFTLGAQLLLRKMAVKRFVAIHVRRGDYLRHHCLAFESFKMSERRFICPNDDDIVGVLNNLDTRMHVVVLTNDMKLLSSLRDRLGASRHIVGLQDVLPMTASVIKTEFGIEKTEIGIVEQVIGTMADAFIGVGISSFSGTIMSGRDVNNIPYNCTITWQEVFKNGINC